MTDYDSSCSITVSDILEYIYCPRFIYFMYCLSIPQYEEKRFKVQMGRTIHEKKKAENTTYLRKKLGVVSRNQEVYLSSDKYHIRGIIDDVLTVSDGSMSPFEYKFAEFKEVIPDTYRIQLIFHALLILENFHTVVNKGFLCFVRSNNMIKEIEITSEDIYNVIDLVNQILLIIQKGTYPPATKNTNRCNDCTYCRICD